MEDKKFVFTGAFTPIFKLAFTSKVMGLRLEI